MDTRCERQLHIRLGTGDTRWLTRPIQVRQEHTAAYEPLVRLGREHEQRVYARLRAALGADCIAALRPPRRREVIPTRLVPDHLRALHARLVGKEHLVVLLEHAWPLHPRFLCQVYGLSPGAALPTAGDRCADRWLRPDLHILGGLASDRVQGARVLGPGGERVWLSPERLRGRVGIALVDVKHAHPDRVGRRHFVELRLYAHALAVWLHEVGLEEQFFVRVDGHGILGRQEDEVLLGASAAALTWSPSVGRVGVPEPGVPLLVTPLVWDDMAQLFVQVQDVVRSLWQRVERGGTVDDAPPCIQPACGRCPFLADCTAQLQPTGDGQTWDVRLIPYLRPAVAQQLRAQGMETVGALLAGLDAGLLGGDEAIPSALHAELPSLRLRATALAEGRTRLPGLGFLSLALPRTIHLALVFDLEVDPIHEVVFGFGLYLDVRNPSRADALAEPHLRWWSACRRYLQALERGEPAEPGWLEAALDRASLEALYEGEDLPGWLEGSMRDAAEALAILRVGGRLQIGLPGESHPGGLLTAPLVRHAYSYVSGGLEPHHELQLLANLVQQAHALLRLCTVVEDCVLVVDAVGGQVRRQRLAGFFWSREQVDHLRALIERHLPELRAGDGLSQQFDSLVDWMTPAESDVGHPALHRKMYDLRAFVEGAAGLPQIISYAWHTTLAAVRQARGVATDVRVDTRCWAPHFNYMDFTVWHEALAELDTTHRAARERHIREEIDRKMAGLHEILRHLHREAQEILPREAWTLSNRDFSAPDQRFHRLAQLWYRYSRLNAATSALEADAHRTTWPEQAVARLRAGALSDLQIQEDGHEEDGVLYDRFTFWLVGLSSNLKAGAGDYILLLHRDLRDFGVGAWLADRAAPFRILSMDWDAAARGYRVVAVSRAWGADVYRRRRIWRQQDRPDDAIYALLERLPSVGWHVYLATGDVWSGRLGGNRAALLTRQRLGTSWLGQRRVFLQDLGGTALAEPLPAQQRVEAPEVYLYAPDLLPTDASPPAMLHAERARRLDASQAAAVRRALAGPVVCIQGPPGTGKSQTIAALLDEAVHRASAAGRPLRALVSAFSYPALRVVAQKLRAGAAGHLPILFARSAGRAPESFASHEVLPDVIDLCYKNGAWYSDGHKLRFSGSIHHGDLFARAGWAVDLDLHRSGFVLFANAHALYHLGRPHPNPQRRFQFLADDFGFDLLIVDEASQLPVDHLAAVVPLVRPFRAQLRLPPRLAETPESLSLLDPPDPADLSRLVLVGDQAQLPPVRALLPPRKLAPLLDSAFRYALDVLQVPQHALAYNYRSHPDIVAAIQQLGLYAQLSAVHTDHRLLGHLPLPSPALPAWLQQVLQPAQVVSAIIHDHPYDTALSPLEARLTVEIIAAVFATLAPTDADAEQRFWAEDVGVVSPHNAHGRLILRETFAHLRPRSLLSDAELMAALSASIYSVEKFQGSDRRLIIGTVGVSSLDQLAAEEAFLYDINRFNVLISRAKQKMILICSQNYLDHVPRDREVMTVAARIRTLATVFCDQQMPITVAGDRLTLRWHHARP